MTSHSGKYVGGVLTPNEFQVKSEKLQVARYKVQGTNVVGRISAALSDTEFSSKRGVLPACMQVRGVSRSASFNPELIHSQN